MTGIDTHIHTQTEIEQKKPKIDPANKNETKHWSVPESNCPGFYIHSHTHTH